MGVLFNHFPLYLLKAGSLTKPRADMTVTSPSNSPIFVPYSTVAIGFYMVTPAVL